MNLNLSAATRWGLNGALILAAVVALYFGRTIFIPTVLALLFAAILGPAAVYLKRGLPLPSLARREAFPWFRLVLVPVQVPWTISCTIVVSSLVVLALLVTVGFGLAVPKLLQDLPTTPDQQTRAYEKFRKKLEAISPVLVENNNYFPEQPDDSAVFQIIRRALNPDNPYIINTLKEVGSLGMGFLWQWVLIMFILLFLLLEGPMLTRRVVEVFGPSQEVQSKVVEALTDMAGQVRTYVVWRTIVNFGLGLVLGLVYQQLGLSQPWTWAMLTAVLCYIPYLGPIAAGIPPVLDAFVTGPSPWYAVGVLAFYLVVVTVEGYLIVPVVMGRPMQLNATTVLLACLFWDLVWGTTGLFLAMPLMAAIKAVCTHVPDWQAWANLMSTETPPPPTMPPEAPAVRAILDETEVLNNSTAAPVGASGASVLKGE